MSSLLQIVDSIATARVRICSREFDAHVLSGLETDLISRLYPRPDPPMKPDGSRGSLAPPVADPDDPEYVAQSEGWFAEHVFRCVAAGLRDCGVGCVWPKVTHTNHASPEVRDAAKKYIDAAWPVIARLPLRDVRAAYSVVAGERLSIADAEKN